MTGGAVGRLYDRLCGYESHRSEDAYPIHKRLSFDDPRIKDTYDWIVQSTAVGPGSDVLDAGCGVGFGSAKLARAADRVRVLGISVSEAEIVLARRYSRGSKKDLRFFAASFDTILPEQFDVIVAVESLKHSADLVASLNRLAAALKRGGQLMIVDDYYSGSPDSRWALRLAEAWQLPELQRAEQVTGALGTMSCSSDDLTRHVHLRSAAELRLRYMGLSLAAMIPGSTGGIARIFRGGLALERLYADGTMRYLAIRYRKPSRSSR